MTTLESALQSDTKRETNGSGQRSVDWQNPRVTAILSAAAKCFAQKGFSATTLAEIGKELGLRKSIVHYYFASKTALIHEVQSFTYHQYLDRMKESITGSNASVTGALQALWRAVRESKTSTGLNIEVWGAARRDSELKERAATLQRDARIMIGKTIASAIGDSDPARVESLATLVLAVVNGLSVTDYLEGENAKVQEAYDTFLKLLRQNIGT